MTRNISLVCMYLCTTNEIPMYILLLMETSVNLNARALVYCDITVP